MKRGEIWTVSAGGDYAGKPRPAVVVQDDRFERTRSISVCAFTSDSTDAPLIRVLIEPDEHNGLRVPSRIMVDKLTTVSRSKLGAQVGRLTSKDVVRLNRAVMVFLGLAGE